MSINFGKKLNNSDNFMERKTAYSATGLCGSTASCGDSAASPCRESAGTCAGSGSACSGAGTLRRARRRSSGFTLSEILMTVAILAVLFALAVPGVAALKRNLKLRELNDCARQIFLAAQNTLTASDAAGTIDENWKKPSSAEGATSAWYYKGSDQVKALLPANSIEGKVSGNCYSIKVDFASATVLDVLYCEESPIFEGSESDYSGTDHESKRRSDYVGWYSGKNIDARSKVQYIPLQVSLDNAEELLLNINVPCFDENVVTKYAALNKQLSGKDITFKIRIFELDKDGKHVKDDLAEKYIDLKDEKVKFEKTSGAQVTILLDSLTNNYRFKNLCSDITPGANIEVSVLASCENKVGAEYGFLSSLKKASGNSLFSSVYYGKDDDSDPSQITITNPRHLQNLAAKVSGVALDEKGARKWDVIQAMDKSAEDTLGIDWSKARTISADSKTYKNITVQFSEDASGKRTVVYGDKIPFVPIDNTSINNYYNTRNSAGEYYQIRNLWITPESSAGLTDVGLFSEYLGARLNNVKLVNARISTGEPGSTGALAGKVTDTAVFGCTVWTDNFVVSDDGKYSIGSDGEKATDSAFDYLAYKLSSDAKNVGGLIGSLSGGTVMSSSSSWASIDASNEKAVVGGLIGVASDGTVKESYADTGLLKAKDGQIAGEKETCWNEESGILAGTRAGEGGVSLSSNGTAGGLFGTAESVSAENCYAMGYIAGSKNAGGFAGAGSNDSAKICYSLVYFNESIYKKSAEQGAEGVSSGFAPAGVFADAFSDESGFRFWKSGNCQDNKIEETEESSGKKLVANPNAVKREFFIGNSDEAKAFFSYSSGEFKSAFLKRNDAAPEMSGADAFPYSPDLVDHEDVNKYGSERFLFMKLEGFDHHGDWPYEDVIELTLPEPSVVIVDDYGTEADGTFYDNGKLYADITVTLPDKDTKEYPEGESYADWKDLYNTFYSSETDPGLKLKLKVSVEELDKNGNPVEGKKLAFVAQMKNGYVVTERVKATDGSEISATLLVRSEETEPAPIEFKYEYDRSSETGCSVLRLYLDKLSSDPNDRFNNLCAGFTPGANIKVSAELLEVEQDNYLLRQNEETKSSSYDMYNSLFAADSYDKLRSSFEKSSSENIDSTEKIEKTATELIEEFAKANKTELARIASTRHLQNLNITTSGVNKEDTLPVKVTSAKQIGTVDWALAKDNSPAAKDVFSFTPINNELLDSFVGNETDAETDYLISNLYINTLSSKAGGLFGRFYGSRISGVRLVNESIDTVRGTADYVGGLSGYIKGTEVTDCRIYQDHFIEAKDITKTISPSMGAFADYIGGLIGYVDGGKISSSFASWPAITGLSAGYAGGLAGYVTGAEIDGSYADTGLLTKNEKGEWEWYSGLAADKDSSGVAGGFAGYADGTKFNNCYSMGYVESAEVSGGFVGDGNFTVDGDNDGSEFSCYSYVYASIKDNGPSIRKGFTNGTVSGDGYLFWKFGNCQDSKTDAEHASSRIEMEKTSRTETVSTYSKGSDDNFNFTTVGLPHYGDWARDVNFAVKVIYEKNLDGIIKKTEYDLKNADPNQDYVIPYTEGPENDKYIGWDLSGFGYKTGDKITVQIGGENTYIFSPYKGKVIIDNGVDEPIETDIIQTKETDPKYDLKILFREVDDKEAKEGTEEEKPSKRYTLLIDKSMISADIVITISETQWKLSFDFNGVKLEDAVWPAGEDTELYAQYKDADGREGYRTDAIYIYGTEEDISSTLLMPSSAGKKFVGWYSAPVPGTKDKPFSKENPVRFEWDKDHLTADQTVYAKWETVETYSISVYGNKTGKQPEYVSWVKAEDPWKSKESIKGDLNSLVTGTLTQDMVTVIVNGKVAEAGAYYTLSENAGVMSIHIPKVSGDTVIVLKQYVALYYKNMGTSELHSAEIRDPENRYLDLEDSNGILIGKMEIKNVGEFDLPDISYTYNKPAFEKPASEAHSYTYDYEADRAIATETSDYIYDFWTTEEKSEADIPPVSNPLITSDYVNELYAKWSPNEFDIAYNFNGGFFPSDIEPGYYSEGKYSVADTPLSFAEPEKEDSNFMGWYTTAKDAAADEPNEAHRIEGLVHNQTGNIELYARWKPFWKVQFFRHESDTQPIVLSNSDTQISVEDGRSIRGMGKESLIPVSLSDEGEYKFTGKWYTADGKEFNADSAVTEDTDVFAGWAKSGYTVQVIWGSGNKDKSGQYVVNTSDPKTDHSWDSSKHSELDKISEQFTNDKVTVVSDGKIRQKDEYYSLINDSKITYGTYESETELPLDPGKNYHTEYIDGKEVRYYPNGTKAGSEISSTDVNLLLEAVKHTKGTVFTYAGKGYIYQADYSLVGDPEKATKNNYPYYEKEAVDLQTQHDNMDVFLLKRSNASHTYVRFYSVEGCCGSGSGWYVSEIKFKYQQVKFKYNTETYTSSKAINIAEVDSDTLIFVDQYAVVYYLNNDSLRNTETAKITGDVVRYPNDDIPYDMAYQIYGKTGTLQFTAASIGDARFTGEWLRIDPEPADGDQNAEKAKAGEAYENIDESKTLVFNADWIPVKYKVHFDPNGNGEKVEGTMEDLELTYGKAEALSLNAFKREGYRFTGWNTLAAPTIENKGTAYKDGQTVKNLTGVPDSTVTLYAQWREKEKLPAPEISILGDEISGPDDAYQTKLVAKISIPAIPEDVPRPEGGSYELSVKIVGLESGNECTPAGITLPIYDPDKGADFEILLDSLESGKHFSDICSSLIPGENITVQCKIVFVPAEGKAEEFGPNSAEESTNSLYAYDSGDAVSAAARISSCRHLQNLACSVSGVNTAGTAVSVSSAVQKCNIDWTKAAGYSYIPIENTGLASYDGSNKTISNIMTSVSDNAGLFGTVSGSMSVRSLMLEDCSFESTSADAGSIVGHVSDGTLTLESVLATSEIGSVDAAGCAGGLVGSSDVSVTVKNSASNLMVTASGSAGGLIGQIFEGNLDISACYTGGHTNQKKYVDSSIHSSAAYSGGIVGCAENGATVKIEKSFSAAAVSGETAAGGIIGLDNASSTVLYYVYAIAPVEGVLDADGAVDPASAKGAFIGKAAGSIDDTQCYYLPEVYAESEHFDITELGITVSNIPYVGGSDPKEGDIPSCMQNRVQLAYYDKEGNKNPISATAENGANMSVKTTPFDAELKGNEYPFAIWTSLIFSSSGSGGNTGKTYGTYYGDWQPVLNPQSDPAVIRFAYKHPVDGSLNNASGSLAEQRLFKWENNTMLLPYLSPMDNFKVIYWELCDPETKEPISDKEGNPVRIIPENGKITILKEYCTDDLLAVANYEKLEQNEYTVFFYYNPDDPSGTKGTGSQRLLTSLRVPQGTTYAEIAEMSGFPVKDIPEFYFYAWYGSAEYKIGDEIVFSENPDVITKDITAYAKYSENSYYTVTVDYVYMIGNGAVDVTNVSHFPGSTSQLRLRKLVTEPVENLEITLPDFSEYKIDKTKTTVMNKDPDDTNGTIAFTDETAKDRIVINVKSGRDTEFMVVYSVNATVDYRLKYVLHNTNTDGTFNISKDAVREYYYSKTDAEAGDIYHTVDEGVPSVSFTAPEGFTCSNAVIEYRKNPDGTFFEKDGYREIILEFDRNSYALTFNLNGGAGNFADQYVMYGQPIAKPSNNPTRTGYVFSSWTLTASDGKIGWGSPMPSGAVVASAGWNKGTVGFRIEYMYQNPNGVGYSYGYSFNKTATTESTVLPGSYKNLRTDTGFYYSDHNSSADNPESGGVTVKADGSTVLHVYFDREMCHVIFWDSRGKSELTDLHIDALYGADVSSLWPSEKDSNKWPSLWIVSDKNKSDTSTWQANIGILNYISAQNNNTLYFRQISDLSNGKAYYYTEVLSGEPYDVTYKDRKYKLDHTDVGASTSAVITKEDSYAINGFTFLEYNATQSSSRYYKYNNAKFYYTRNIYTLEFSVLAPDGTYKTEQISVPYQASIKPYENTMPYAPSDAEISGYDFSGWYSDSDLKNYPFSFGTESNPVKMPANNIAVYGRWIGKPCTVTFVLDPTEKFPGLEPGEDRVLSDHERGTSIGIPFDDYVPAKEGYTFKGWEIRVDGGTSRPVTRDSIISGDTYLYPVWLKDTQVEDRTITVKYLIDGSDPEQEIPEALIPKDAPREISYFVGGTIRVTAADISGYIAKSMGIDYRVSTADNQMIKFYYSKIEPWKYSVEYRLSYTPVIPTEDDMAVISRAGYTPETTGGIFQLSSGEMRNAENQYETITFTLPEGFESYRLKGYEVNGRYDGKERKDEGESSSITINPSDKGYTTSVIFYIEPDPYSITLTDKYSLYDGTDQNLLADNTEVIFRAVSSASGNVQTVKNVNISSCEGSAINAGAYSMKAYVLTEVEESGKTHVFLIGRNTSGELNLQIGKRSYVFLSGIGEGQYGASDYITAQTVKITGDIFNESEYNPDHYYSFSEFTASSMPSGLFPSGEGFTFDSTVESFKVDPGDKQNAFKYTPISGTNKENYIITVQYGRLEVFWNYKVLYLKAVDGAEDMILKSISERSTESVSSVEFIEDFVPGYEFDHYEYNEVLNGSSKVVEILPGPEISSDGYNAVVKFYVKDKDASADEGNGPKSFSASLFGMRKTMQSVPEMLEMEIPSEGHAHIEVTDAAVIPTCTEPGLSVGAHCSVCGEILKAQEEIAPLGHAEVTDEAVAPTCTESGLTEGTHCSVCGDVLTAQEEVPALGHTEAIDEAVAPTCTESGLTEGSHCSVCGEVLTAQEEVPALSHTEVIDEAVPATCTENGLTEGAHCSVCGEILVSQEAVPALGHTEVIDEAIAPNCTESGWTEGSHCSVCGAILTAQEEVAPFGHTVVTDEAIPATCTEPGLSEGSHCAVCGEVFIEQEMIPAAHTIVIDEAVEPTWTEFGWTEGNHCSACGEVFVPQEEILPLEIQESIAEAEAFEAQVLSVVGVEPVKCTASDADLLRALFGDDGALEAELNYQDMLTADFFNKLAFGELPESVDPEKEPLMVQSGSSLYLKLSGSDFDHELSVSCNGFADASVARASDGTAYICLTAYSVFEDSAVHVTVTVEDYETGFDVTVLAAASDTRMNLSDEIW